MAQLKIELLGSSILRQRAAEIVEIDEEMRRLVADMFDTMYAAEGIGLAGPQVGVAKRVVVVDVKEEEGEPPARYAIINPTILERGAAVEKAEEGCLSIPGVSSQVERATRVVVEAVDDTGSPIRIEAEGLLARCLLHEIDHLEGVLFIDHLSALKRSMLLKKYRQYLAEELAEAEGKAPARRGR